MKGYLLDVNVLLALAWPEHVHHDVADAWWGRHHRAGWATCLVTQLGFVRLSSHPAFTPRYRTPKEALGLLREITSAPGHRFFAEPTSGVEERHIDDTVGQALVHSQVTDAYLVGLARLRGGQLATLDGPLARLFPEEVVLIAAPARSH